MGFFRQGIIIFKNISIKGSNNNNSKQLFEDTNGFFIQTFLLQIFFYLRTVLVVDLTFKFKVSI